MRKQAIAEDGESIRPAQVVRGVDWDCVVRFASGRLGSVSLIHS